MCHPVDWPSSKFQYNPNMLEELFGNHLKNFASKLSNDNFINISLLDIPGFGSMIDSFQSHYCALPWPNQLNMAVYDRVKDGR